VEGACVLSTLPSIASAQRSNGLIEVGAARLSQRDVPPTDAITAGASGRHDAPRYTFGAAGGVTLAEDGRSTVQGLFTASLLAHPGKRARWEIGGALTLFKEASFATDGGAYLLARQHFTAGGFGGWAGVAVGGVEDASYWSPTRTAEIASWFARRDARLTAVALLVDTRSEPYVSQGRLVTDPITYADGSVDLRWAFQRLELDARGGVRVISRGALTATGRGTRPFAAVDAAIWVTPRVAVVVAMGRQLADLPRGTPDTRFASLALRLTARDRSSQPRPPTHRPDVPAQLRLVLVGDTTGQSRLVVAVAAATIVELAASFTSWAPVTLVRRGEVWEFDRPIPSGAHRVLVRVDRGPWIVPANLPSAADDFGGTVGIITVP
jgi:hypothetical protein